MKLTRVDGEPQPVMFLRVMNKDDHRDFEWLLPQCSPMFVYADEDGRDWVRWSIPKPVAKQIGYDDGCSCCGKTDSTGGAEHAVLVDMAYDEVEWFLEMAG